VARGQAMVDLYDQRAFSERAGDGPPARPQEPILRLQTRLLNCAPKLACGNGA
jgi:hypothetical protein